MAAKYKKCSAFSLFKETAVHQTLFLRLVRSLLVFFISFRETPKAAGTFFLRPEHPRGNANDGYDRIRL